MAIIIKNSQVATKQPSTADLQVGQLGVNTADGVLYTKHSDNTIKNLTGVQLSGNQTIAGVKTFSDGVVANVTGNVTGNVSGNSGTVTNGVYTTGDQTIAGIKTFSSSPIVPTATTNEQAVNFGQTVGKMLGVGQTWQDVTASRASGVTYTNTTGKPISVIADCGATSTDAGATVNGLGITRQRNTGSNVAYPFSFVVPNGGTYSIVATSLLAWHELR